MPLAIRRFVGGPLETNSYLLSDTTTGDAVLVDAPPGITSEVVAAVESVGADVDRIVLTHGHWDHVLGLAELKQALDARVYGYAGLASRLESGAVSRNAPEPMAPSTLDQSLSEGDEVCVGGHAFTVRHMPGHDADHIVLVDLESGVVIGGDVLFPGGHGRTDLPGSDQRAMNRTLRRFLDLPDDVRVLPGHGDETRVGVERPWIERIDTGE